MNIFFLDKDPRLAAEYHCDKHVVKMILESAQLLSTAHRLLDGQMYIEQKATTGRNVKRWRLNDEREKVLYGVTHINHPSAVWSRSNIDHYRYLYDLFVYLMDEYTYRYGKVHKCTTLAKYLSSPPFNLNDYTQTPILCAMDKKFIISENGVENYRNYYIMGKKHLAKWTKRSPPEWYIQN